MNMGMMLQGLTPGVQDGGDAELGAEMLWIGGDGGERLGCRSHQDGIDGRLILESDLGRRRRQGEDDVEIGHGQKLGLPGGEPLRPGQPLALRAVAIAARVVGDAGHAAVCTGFDMAAERRRAAGHDGAHDAPLCAAEMAFVIAAIGVAVPAEDVRHLQSRGHVTRPIRRAARPPASVDRAGSPSAG